MQSHHKARIAFINGMLGRQDLTMNERITLVCEKLEIGGYK